jgi:DNA uptake protein ComE-like DNA-binding protein
MDGRALIAHMFLSLIAALVLMAGIPHGQAAGQANPKADAKPAALSNVNAASATELETLPGVGAATTARIVEYRQKNGPVQETGRDCKQVRVAPETLSVLHARRKQVPY